MSDFVRWERRRIVAFFAGFVPYVILAVVGAPWWMITPFFLLWAWAFLEITLPLWMLVAKRLDAALQRKIEGDK